MRKKIILITIVLINVSIIFAQNPKFSKLYADKSKSTISYSMNHPLHAWTAVSHDVSSVILYNNKDKMISQAAVSVNIASFDSKNANRDSHTIEVTEALKYPKITFLSKSIITDGDVFKITGTINFHGINQEISFKASKKVKKSKIQISGNFTVLMSKFNIDPPSLMGIATDDEIKIAFDVLY